MLPARFAAWGSAPGTARQAARPASARRCPSRQSRHPISQAAATADDARLKAEAKEKEFNDKIDRLKAALSKM
jgi:hypothetical protein